MITSFRINAKRGKGSKDATYLEVIDPDDLCRIQTTLFTTLFLEEGMLLLQDRYKGVGGYL